MWKLFQCSSNVRRLLHQPSALKCNALKSFYTKEIREQFTNSVRNQRPKKNYSLCSFTKIGLTLTFGTICKISLNNRVLCKASTSRLVGYRTGADAEIKFNWKHFWHYVKPHIWYLIAAIVGALAVALLNIEIPQIVGGVINVVAKYSESHDSDLFLNEMQRPAIKLVFLYIAQSVFTFFYINMLSHLGEKVAFNMKTDLFKTILKQEIAFFDQHRTGEIINRLTTDVQEFKSSFKQTVSGGLRAGTQIIGCTISLIVISPQMTFVTLLCIPAVVAVGTAIGSLLRHTSRKVQVQVEKTTAVADEAISNIRTVRAFAMEEQEIELFEKEAIKAMNLNEKLGFGIGLFQAGTNMFLNSVILATLYMGGYLLSTNQLSAGQLMAYLMATQTIQRSLAQLSLLFGSVIRGIAAGSRVFQYIEMKPEITLYEGKMLSKYEMKSNIEFKMSCLHIRQGLNMQIILQNFNLIIPAGKTVAIVGASGSGKSTIATLLERFYDINKGIITLDGHDISTLNPTWLRQQVFGYISQEPILFATSIIENIRYGKPDAADTDVIEAAQLANAHDFIIDFPDGYNTLVGERGITLSGGQKQRIAIARALLKKPLILILDEATSALDSESEKIVQVALERARKGRTVLIIAHRLSTIHNADIIVVLNKGNIVEMGTHEELKAKKGYYWSLNFEQEAAST